jgi:hypothetical protein
VTALRCSAQSGPSIHAEQTKECIMTHRMLKLLLGIAAAVSLAACATFDADPSSEAFGGTAPAEWDHPYHGA